MNNTVSTRDPVSTDKVSSPIKPVLATKITAIPAIVLVTNSTQLPSSTSSYQQQQQQQKDKNSSSSQTTDLSAEKENGQEEDSESEEDKILFGEGARWVYEHELPPKKEETTKYDKNGRPIRANRGVPPETLILDLSSTKESYDVKRIRTVDLSEIDKQYKESGLFEDDSDDQVIQQEAELEELDSDFIAGEEEEEEEVSEEYESDDDEDDEDYEEEESDDDEEDEEDEYLLEYYDKMEKIKPADYSDNEEDEDEEEEEQENEYDNEHRSSNKNQNRKRKADEIDSEIVKQNNVKKPKPAKEE